MLHPDQAEASMADDRVVMWASGVTLAACVLGVGWIALLLG
jgi:hypothetical protein